MLHTDIRPSVQSLEQVAPSLREQVDQLTKLVAPTWPLATAVACNPLQGLENLPFAEAVQVGQALFDADTLPGFWQLRQARAQGHLTQEAFDQAYEQVLAEVPEYLSLGTHDVYMPVVIEAFLLQLDERTPVSSHSDRLTKVLPYLTDKRPWEGSLLVVNEAVLPWLSAFIDEGQAAWTMPYRDQGLFVAVKRLVVHERRYRSQRAWLKSLPDDSLAALDALLDRLDITEEQRNDFLRDHLLSLPGWASLIRWRETQSSYLPQQQYPASLTDYLTLRVLFASLLSADGHSSPDVVPKELSRLHHWAEQLLTPSAEVTEVQWADLLGTLRNAYRSLQLSLLTAWEDDFRQELGDQLFRQPTGLPTLHRPDAQMVFCIDVRSEPFRRQVEAVGDYETLGFAGFFGLPIAYQDALGKTVNSLPVLLQPAHHLHSHAQPACSHHEQGHRKGLRLIHDLKHAYKSLKYNLSTPFAAVEALGLAAGLMMVGRNLMPGSLTRFRSWGQGKISPQVDLVPDVTPQDTHGIPMEQQVSYAGNALRMMGLTRNFAPLVVLCGHGSKTENNPYAAALECGACGGSHGGPNAAAMARVLNQAEVRAHLRAEGILIPDDTLFVGAEHNTTTDAVRLLDLPSLSEEKQVQIADLKVGLQRAQRANLSVRAHHLGEQRAAQILRKSSDWSEVRPEWGLAGNAGFVVAPRAMTETLDLKGRCFLHSYDWQQDDSSSSLEVILTAPLVVAQWINSQYFFSTVDPVAFGSGSKITHNVVGKVGVMQGNASDLMHGLPMQSVMSDDERLYHHPLRLTAFVVAPQSRVQALVDKHAILQQMFFNEWVALQVYDPETRQLLRLTSDGEWEPLRDSTYV